MKPQFELFILFILSILPVTSILISSSFPPLTIFAITKMKGIMKSVSAFYGRKEGYEDPFEYLETMNSVVVEKIP